MSATGWLHQGGRNRVGRVTKQRGAEIGRFARIAEWFRKIRCRKHKRSLLLQVMAYRRRNAYALSAENSAVWSHCGRLLCAIAPLIGAQVFRRCGRRQVNLA